MANTIGLALGLTVIASMWRVFQKAGTPGWHSIVPIYNIFATFRIADLPMWQAGALVAMLAARAIIQNTIGFSSLAILAVPLFAGSAGLWVMACMGLASKFGRGTGFAVGLAVVPFVFFPILAFGSGTYGQPEPRETLGLSGV